MNSEEYAKYIIRQFIRESISNTLMKDILQNGRINLLMAATLYGAPYSTKPYILRRYAEKKEELFKLDLAHIFNDNLIINHEKKANEILAYTKDNKQLFTIKLSSDRLIPSYIRFDFLTPKEKIKVPVTISVEEVEKLILNKKQNMIDAGFDYIFK